ncbi:MAG: hypothetical protein IKU48_00030 [Clostridia bacterium]|nr:hypothetical protein [Clostridia bacterium]
MYMGTQKKAVVLKPGVNSIVEEAYFIIKDDFSNIKESEMIREANKILKNNMVGSFFFENEKNKESKAQKNGVTYFLLGAFLSFVLCTFFFLLLK